MNNVMDDFDASKIVLFVYFRTLQQSGCIMYICQLGLVSQSLYYLDETFLYTDRLNDESSDQVVVMVYVNFVGIYGPDGSYLPSI
jgi:hypothetical protein